MRLNLILPFTLKTIAYFILFCLVYTLAFLSAAHAQSYQQPPILSSQSPNIATQALYSFGHAISCVLTGQSSLSPCLEYKFSKNLEGLTTATPYLSSVNTSGGLLGVSTSMVGLLYQEKPLDQMSFFAYLGRNLGVIKEANAQVGGSGNQVLSPIFALWTVSRNFSYLIMILVFIVIGLMVMFRQKLNPQTVVSIQMALPGLVVGLILITFSYFLSSLVTDIAYVGTDLVGYYFDEAVRVVDPKFAPPPLTERLKDDSAVSIGAGSTKILDQQTLESFIQQIFDKLPVDTTASYNPLSPKDFLTPRGVIKTFSASLTYMLYNTMLSPIFDVLGGVTSGVSQLKNIPNAIKGVTIPKAGLFRNIGNILNPVSALVGGGGTSIAAGYGLAAYNDPVEYLTFWATILAVLILLYTILRLFFKLISCYLTIIFLTIASPFVFLASSIPGRQDMAISWARNMLCNVLSFPAVIAVFYFAAFLIGPANGADNPAIPGFLVTGQLDITSGAGNLPFLGGLNLVFLRKILAFAAILTTPSIPDIICRTVGKPGQGGAMLAGAVSGAIAGGRNYQGQIQGQIQGAGKDVASWQHSLLGSKQYTGGRLGAFQQKATEAERERTGTAGIQVGQSLDTSGTVSPAYRMINRLSNWTNAFRKSKKTSIPSSPYDQPAVGAKSESFG